MGINAPLLLLPWLFWHSTGFVSSLLKTSCLNWFWLLRTTSTIRNHSRYFWVQCCGLFRNSPSLAWKSYGKIRSYAGDHFLTINTHLNIRSREKPFQYAQNHNQSAPLPTRLGEGLEYGLWLYLSLKNASWTILFGLLSQKTKAKNTPNNPLPRFLAGRG